tara:strand:- start:391 stop:801 length:411 start_codon:yes stop_codon:yes gene_type:complete
MDKHVIYIWIDDREFIEIYDSSFNFGFDDYYNISNLEIYFNDSSYKGNINKIQNGSNISVESNEFYVEKATISNYIKLDEDLDGITLENFEIKKNVYCLNINFYSKFITSDDFEITKRFLNRKRNLNEILKIGKER